VIGDTTELVSGSDRTLRVFGMHRSQMEGTLTLSDARTGEPALLIERGQFKGAMFSRPCTVKLYDPSDRLLAWFEAGSPHGMVVNWNADCWLRDDRDRKWAVAEGPKYPRPDYDIRSRDGDVLARVCGEGRTSGFLAPGISWTAQKGELRLTLHGRAAREPVLKLVLLGAVVACESIISSMYIARP
jgi:hypothetical protein